MTRVGIRVVVAGVVGVLTLLLSSGLATACDCPEANVDRQAEESDVVVRGNVEAIELDTGEDAAGSLNTYTVSVTRVWKGDVGAELTFDTARDVDSCGLVGIEEGQDIVLFAVGDAESLSANSCSGTAVATEELVAQVGERLGDGTVPEGAGDANPVPGDESGWGLPTAIAAVAVLGAVVVYARRIVRRRKEAEEFAHEAVRHSDTPVEPEG